MTPEIAQLFAETKSPTHCCAADVRDMTRPMLLLGTTVQQQVALYRQQLYAALHTEHDGELDGKFERMKQTLAALDATVPAFLESGERIVQAFMRWSRIMAESEQDITAYAQRVDAARAAALQTSEGIETTEETDMKVLP